MPDITHPSQLPAVDKVLQAPGLQPLRQTYGLEACTRAVREVLGGLRQQLLDGEKAPLLADPASIVQAAQQRLEHDTAGCHPAADGDAQENTRQTSSK